MLKKPTEFTELNDGEREYDGGKLSTDQIAGLAILGAMFVGLAGAGIYKVASDFMAKQAMMPEGECLKIRVGSIDESALEGKFKCNGSFMKNGQTYKVWVPITDPRNMPPF